MKLKKKKRFLQVFFNVLDIEKVLVSTKTVCGEKNYKYFIGFLYNDHIVTPLHIILPKTSIYVKDYDG